MKLLKTSGLLAAALVAAMAIFGAASAMAESTQICSQDPAGGTCPTGSAVSHEHFTDPLALLFAEGAFGLKVDILCEALYLGDSLGLGAPSVSHGGWTFSAPHGGTGNCVNMETGNQCGTIKQTSSTALTSILRTGDEKGTVEGSAEVLVECAGLHCVYNGVGLKGSATGSLLGGNGEVAIVAQEVNKVSGLACPTTSKLTIHAVPLVALYIGK